MIDADEDGDVCDDDDEEATNGSCCEENNAETH